MKFLLLLPLLAAAVWGGAAIQSAHAHRLAKESADRPLAMIALNQCDHFLGALIVTQEGKVRPFAGMPLDAAQELAKQIPSEVVETPCGPPPTGT